jgi:hypothetical protein
MGFFAHPLKKVQSKCNTGYYCDKTAAGQYKYSMLYILVGLIFYGFSEYFVGLLLLL